MQLTRVGSHFLGSVDLATISWLSAARRKALDQGSGRRGMGRAPRPGRDAKAESQ